MKKIFCAIISIYCFASKCVVAQLTGVITEEINSGGIGSIPSGYATYRIYALLKDPTDRISAVFGSTTPSPVHHLKIHSSAEGDVIWNSSYAGALGSNNNCAFWGFFPEAEFDSHVTIGVLTTASDNCPDCRGETGNIFQITNPANKIMETFAPSRSSFGPDLDVVDGSWFLPNDGTCNGFPTGSDNRVLLAQVTLPRATLEYWLNISVFDEAVGKNQLVYVHDRQDPPGIVGEWPEIDGKNLGLVYPTGN